MDKILHIIFLEDKIEFLDSLSGYTIRTQGNFMYGQLILMNEAAMRFVVKFPLMLSQLPTMANSIQLNLHGHNSVTKGEYKRSDVSNFRLESLHFSSPLYSKLFST